MPANAAIPRIFDLIDDLLSRNTRLADVEFVSCDRRVTMGSGRRLLNIDGASRVLGDVNSAALVPPRT
jgi:hypothetical protein